MCKHTPNSSLMVPKERKHILGFPIHPSAPPVSKGDSGMFSPPLSSFISHFLLRLSSETVAQHTHTDTHLPFSLLPGPGNFWILNRAVKNGLGVRERFFPKGKIVLLLHSEMLLSTTLLRSLFKKTTLTCNNIN